MSRTNRKTALTREQAFGDYYIETVEPTRQKRDARKWQTNPSQWEFRKRDKSLPKAFRKMNTKIRRAKDALALKLENDNFALWNCKDSNNWGYW